MEDLVKDIFIPFIKLTVQRNFIALNEVFVRDNIAFVKCLVSEGLHLA